MKASATDERSIIDGLKAQDALAIDDFVNRYSKPLFGVILNYLKDPADAEEVLQETLLKVVRKIGTFREESHLWPWMKRIAINNCIMWLRKHRAVREREVQMEDELPQFNRDGYHKTLINDWPVDPESIALNSELSQLLYDAIQSLPYEYRVPLVLRDVEGYSIREIATLLDLKEATTKTRIHRARLFVREKLSTYFEGR